TFHQRRINTALGAKRSTHEQSLADDDVPPGLRHAVFANTNLDAMQTHWAVVTALHVVLARPDQLDGSSLHAFCDGRGFALHVAVQHGATSEAATRHLRVKSDLLRL